MRGVALAIALAVAFLPAAARGEPANGGSFVAAISGDGRYVAFESAASNLVRGDRNGAVDIFVRDRLTSQTQRVSVGPQGVEANERSYTRQSAPTAATSPSSPWASNLVPGDTNNRPDVFLRDRATGTTELVAGGNDESASPSISADGRYVAFTLIRVGPRLRAMSPGRGTSSSVTGQTGRSSGLTSAAKRPRPPSAAASTRKQRSVRTGATSPSARRHRTSSTATRTARRTCSCATASPEPPSGSASATAAGS